MYAFGSGKEVSLVQKLLRRGDGGRRERRQGSHDRAHRRQGSHTRAHLAAGSHDVIPSVVPQVPVIVFSLWGGSFRFYFLVRTGTPHTKPLSKGGRAHSWHCVHHGPCTRGVCVCVNAGEEGTKTSAFCNYVLSQVDGP